MPRTSAALQVSQEQDVGFTLHSITEFKRAPMHCGFKMTLKEQAERLQDDHNFSDEEVAPTFEFINSREWTSATLPDGADAWAVGTPARIDDYKTSIATGVRKLVLRSPMSVMNEIDLLGPELKLKVGAPYCDDRTSRCMALLRQVQPHTPLIVMAVQLGFGDRHRGYSQEMAVSSFAPNEFSLGDVEFSSIFSTHPEILESQHDRGIVVGGTRYSKNAVAYSIKGHKLRRHLQHVSCIDHSFRVATSFLFH